MLSTETSAAHRRRHRSGSAVPERSGWRTRRAARPSPGRGCSLRRGSRPDTPAHGQKRCRPEAVDLRCQLAIRPRPARSKGRRRCHGVPLLSQRLTIDALFVGLGLGVALGGLPGPRRPTCVRRRCSGDVDAKEALRLTAGHTRSLGRSAGRAPAVDDLLRSPIDLKGISESGRRRCCAAETGANTVGERQNAQRAGDQTTTGKDHLGSPRQQATRSPAGQDKDGPGIASGASLERRLQIAFPRRGARLCGCCTARQCSAARLAGAVKGLP